MPCGGAYRSKTHVVLSPARQCASAPGRGRETHPEPALNVPKTSQFLQSAGGWIAVLLLLACTAAVLVFNTRPRPLGPVLGSAHPAPADHNAFRAYVVLQSEDCDSNLEFLRVFSRPKFRSRISVVGVVTGTDSPGETATAAQLMAAQHSSIEVIEITREIARALTPLGFETTPFLVLLDPQGKVRLATPAPQGYDATRDFDVILEKMTTPTHSLESH